ncbi:hypothetical protein [Thauera propionica]|nr:hypothetical protein [Thauera propionica]MDD3675944.1 hypothetical protein [Thauera propionica]
MKKKNPAFLGAGLISVMHALEVLEHFAANAGGWSRFRILHGLTAMR